MDFLLSPLLERQAELSYQLGVVLSLLAFSFLFSALTGSYIYRQIKRYVASKQATRLEDMVKKYFIPLLTPTVFTVLLAVAAGILYSDKADAGFFLGAAQFSLAWLAIRFVGLFSESNALSVIVGCILIPVTVLNVLGLSGRVAGYLDGYSLQLGKINFSVYAMLKAGLVLSILLYLAGIISRSGKNYIKGLKRIRLSTRELLLKFFDIALYCSVFLIGLNVLGVDLTAFAVVGGAIGVGVGFGLQKITSNFISGIILLFERSIQINDLVELESGIYGYIRHLGARYTLVESFDGREIMIPNEDFITSRVTNWTFSNKHGRIEMAIGVAYGTDLEEAKKLILESATEHPRCMKTPEPSCFITAFADSTINFQLLFWVEDVTDGRLEPRSDVFLAIWKKFQMAGIEIPFPQRDVHLRSATPFSVKK